MNESGDPTMRKTIKWIFIGAAAVVLSIQLVQPDRTNPTVDESKTIDAHLSMPADVKSILVRACYDCHSYNTRWPWYSYVAPVSWLTASDVKKGRASLNFSTWGEYRKRRQLNKLDQIAQELNEGAMPLKAYRLMHPEAALTKSETELVIQWAEKQHSQLGESDSTENREQK